MTGLYNFTHRLDGLAGGMALVGFGASRLSGSVLTQDSAFAAVSLVVAAAAIRFLTFSRPPRMPMGDVGSIPRRFLAAALLVTGWVRGV